MAQTPAAVQAQLSTDPAGPRIIIADEGGGGTEQRWYVVMGNGQGCAKWVRTTASQTAAQQASAIVTSLALGPGYP